MDEHQKQFIEFALQHRALRFGEFVLKSGRRSPYFFDAGMFNHGAALAKLAQYYARAIADSGIAYDMLFGPAYKGIALAASTAVALVEHGRDVAFAFNRKEAKDHGEGGRTLGAPLAGAVLILDDVISAGTSVDETVLLIRQADAVPAGIVIALDRGERGSGQLSAIEEIRERHGIDVASIISIDALLQYLSDLPAMQGHLASVQKYRESYGA